MINQNSLPSRRLINLTLGEKKLRKFVCGYPKSEFFQKSKWSFGTLPFGCSPFFQLLSTANELLIVPVEDSSISRQGKKSNGILFVGTPNLNFSKNPSSHLEYFLLVAPLFFNFFQQPMTYLLSQYKTHQSHVRGKKL